MRVRGSAMALAAGMLVASCDEVDRPLAPPRAPGLDASLEAEPPSGLMGDASAQLVLPEALAGLALAGPPVDVSWSQCPGVRLWRFDPAVPTSHEAPRPASRYFGRDWLGRWVNPRDVLLCELRMHHFVEKGSGEARTLILLRAPWYLYPDGECVWREPATSATVVAPAVDGGHPRLVARRVTLIEHCRRPQRERVLHVDVDLGYETITVEP